MGSPTVHLLPDEPSATDEFAAGAHKRVADAITDLVTSEPGGKVIGLEGLWGSGKSTVVGLVREALAGDPGKKGRHPDTRVIVFDTWSHQGDPLRRTFLEALIGDLEDAGWLDEDVAKTFRDQLTGRTSVVTTNSTSRLSFEGKLAAGATVLLAFGAALFSNRFHTHHRLGIYLGAALLLAPLLVVLGLWCLKQVGVVLGGEAASGWRRKLARLNPSGFFASDRSTETVTEGIQRGDPTSVEFEQIFSDVLALSITGERRLLLVLDNLDRVEERDARTVLATMQTFTGSGISPQPWSSAVWTLIPYDPGGLDRLWTPDSEEGTEPEAVTATTLAFMEKIFQIRFEAPPLVLSDWRSYTARLLAEALPDERKEHLTAVLRLRSLYPGVEPRGHVAREAPTPRQLKQFVNQIGAVRRLRADVPLVHVAYYAMLRRDAIEVPAGLIAGSVPHGKVAHLLESSVREDLAALHFGAERDLAQQLLLRPALETAFAVGDAETIARLRERPGFLDALEALDIEARAEGGGVELANAAAVLNDASAFDLKEVDDWARARLEPLTKRTSSWRLQGRESGRGLAVLLNRIAPSDDDALNEYLAKVVPTPFEADAEGEGHLEGIAGLVDGLSGLGRGTEGLRIRIDISSERLIPSLSHLLQHSERAKALQAVELSASPADVAAALVEAAGANRTRDLDKVLRMLLQRPDRVSLEALAAESLDWLRANEPIDQNQLSLFLDWLDRARRSESPEAVLLGAAQDGTLMHLVAIARANGWQEEAAAASMLHLRVEPELPEPQATRQASVGTAAVRQSLANPEADPPFVDAQLGWLKGHKREAFELIGKISNGQAQQWVDAQMQGLARTGDLQTTPSQYAANWKYLRRVLGNDLFAQHTREMLDSDAGRAKIFADTSDPALAVSALDASRIEPVAEYFSEVVAWAAGIVRAVPAEDWEAALRATDTEPVLDLAVRLSGTKGAPSNPPGLQNALHNHFQTLASGGEGWRPDGATFGRLTRLLASGARGVLASQLCAELEGRDGQVGPELFPTYGEFLAAEPRFRTHSKLPNVIDRFVAHDQWEIVRWFVDLAANHGDTLDPANRKDEMDHLREAVAAKISALGDESPDVLRELSELLES